MVSIIQTGLTAIQRGAQGLQNAAAEIASVGHFNPQSLENPPKAIVESLLEAKVGSHQIQASFEVVKAGDEAIGAILNVMA